MQPKVFIIILNWNGWKDTIECLESLKKIDYSNYKIILIDNGSTDESISQLKKICSVFSVSPFVRGRVKESKIKFLTLNSNLGFAGGNNVGIKYALKNQADYVLLLNNDTTVEPDFLSQLIKVAESDKKIGILGPKINFYQSKNKIWFLGGKINWFLNKGTHLYYDQIDSNLVQNSYKESRKRYWRMSLSDGASQNLPNRPFEVDYFTGCALLIKKEVVKKIGLMWEGYFLYYEDTDWNLKARRNNWKIIVVPKAKIYHKASRSTKEGSFSYIYYHTRNGLYLVKRNASFWIRFCVYFFSIWILAKQIMKLIFVPKKRIWAKAVMKGIEDFYLGRIGKLKD